LALCQAFLGFSENFSLAALRLPSEVLDGQNFARNKTVLFLSTWATCVNVIKSFFWKFNACVNANI
jgi:hypothetical protein